MPPTELFHDLLLSFAENFPNVELEIAATPRNVDLLSNKVDVALRFGHNHPLNMITRCLARDRVSLVASPKYLEARGQPKNPADLAKHDCLISFRDYFSGWLAKTFVQQ